MEPKVAEWIEMVQETFQRLKWADKNVQEDACKSIEEEYEGEAATKLRGLFEAERVRTETASFSLSKSVPRRQPSEPVEEEPRKAAAAGAGVDLRQRFYARVAKARAEERKEQAERGVVVALKPQAQAKPEPEPEPEELSLNKETVKLEVELAERKAAQLPQLVTPGMAAQKPVVALNEMNKRHAVITNLGGKCVVMEWVPSELNAEWEEPSYQSFTAFRERYANRYVEIITDVTGKLQKVGAEPLAGWWLCQPGRRQYEGLGLEPNGPKVLGSHRLNLWRGLGVVAKEGDWSGLRKHLGVVLANEEKRSEEYILKWTAWKFQNPGETPEVAIAFKGKKGVGKGVWMYALLKVFGPHGLQIYNREHLTGKHNKHLQNRLLLCADEAVWAGDKEAERVLKGMVTEKTLTIEPKGVDAFPWRNRLGIVMSTNDKWVVPASWDERRYAVFEVNPIYMQQREYFQPLFAEIDGDGAAAMLYDLLRIDLDGWHPRYDIPQTEALIDQKVQSLDGLEQWWLAKLSTGETPTPSPKNPRWVLSKHLYREAVGHNARTKYVTDTEFGRFLGEMGCEHKSNGKAWGWVFPPLPEARRTWEIKMSGAYEWLRPDIEEWNEGCLKDLLDEV
jgi:hypothetical protein